MKIILKRTFLSILYILIFQINSVSQETQFDYLKEPVVLPGIQINCILKDSRGFIWFGTEQGLVKYDGYDYITYNQVTGENNSLSSLKINALIEDKNKKLWIGTFQGGLNCFDPVTETFHNFFSSNQDSIHFSGQDINALELQADGTLWIGYRNGGLDRFNPETGKIINYRNQQGNNDNIINTGVSALFFDSNENLWIGTWDNGLALLKKEEISSGWKKNPVFEDHSSYYNNSRINKIFSIKEDKNGHIWLSSFGEGIFYYEPNSGRYQSLLIQDNSLPVNNFNSRDMIVLADGNLICGNNVLTFLNINEIKDHFFPSANTGNIIPPASTYSLYPLSEKSMNPLIHSFLMENEDILWVGTNIGVYKLTRKRFEAFRVTDDQYEVDNITAAAITPERKLYFSLWNQGIYYTDIQNGDIRDATYSKLTIPGVNMNEITAITPGMNGNIWFAVMHEGIYKYNPSSKLLTSYNNVIQHQGISDINYCITATLGPNNSIWFGTAAGLIVYYAETDTFYFFSEDPQDPISLNNEYINSIAFGGDSVVWLGTLMGGLNKGIINSNDPGKIAFEHFTYNSSDPKSISENNVSCVYFSSIGDLWVGTANNGLNLYDRKNNNFRRMSKDMGLENSQISSILEDKHQKIWAATRAGLSNLDPSDMSLINYSISLDQQIVYFNKNAAFNLDNLLIFSTRENFIAFDPGKILTHLTMDKVRFTEFMINNQVISPGKKYNQKVVLEKGLDFTEQITLRYNHNTFSIRFSLLDFLEPNKNRYFYKLEGFDKEWRQAPALFRQADYTNLSPGDYVFKVKAINGDGFETPAERNLSVTILPPWYKSIIAVIFYILSLTALTFFIRQITVARLKYINEINTRKLIHEKDNELNTAKLKFFTNISHEIRTPVTLILAPLETLYRTVNDDFLKNQIEIILRNARKLNGLISQLMDFRKIETGKMTLKVNEHEINAFIKEILEDFKGPCAQKNISIEFTSGSETIMTWFDFEKMEKIIQNLLSNALKFTPENGRIEVKTYLSTENHISKESESSVPEYAVIKIKDNGIGIPEKHLTKIFDRFYQVDRENEKHNPVGTGIGLSIVKEFVSLHHGTIYAESIANVETVFTIKLPLGNNHFSESELSDKPAKPASVEKMIENYVPDNSFHYSDDVLEDSAKFVLLIAEDNAELRSFLRTTLNREYKVLEAENGRMAWDIILNNSPDIVISDIMMPEMDGLELTEKIKTDIKTSHLPVILLTAKSEIEDRIAGLKTGADSYIPKPFHPEHLRIRIRKLIELRRMLKKKFSQDIGINVETMNLGSLDAEFLNKLNDIIENNLGDFNLNIEKLCRHVGMSRSNMFKKLKALTGLSPTEYMRNFRLNKALRMMIEDRSLNISDVGYRVGFNSPAYFTQSFRKVYGKAPKEFVEDYLKREKDKHVNGSHLND